MWADTDTDLDFLNYSEVAELIADMIARKDLLPLSLGVFGSWGVGKSSTLRLVANELGKNEKNYLVITFDAWLYQDFDDARAALMSVIASELTKASSPELAEKAKSLFGRINKLRALGLLVEGGALAMGVPTFGLITRGLEGARDVIEGKSDREDYEAIKAAAGDAKEKVSGLLGGVSEKGPPEEIAAFRWRSSLPSCAKIRTGQRRGPICAAPSCSPGHRPKPQKSFLASSEPSLIIHLGCERC